jgi:hypothetical protein
VALLWASEAVIYGRFGYGETTAKWHLSGETRATAFRPTVQLGAGSVGEVDRDAFLPVVKALHAAWSPDRPGSLVRTDAWWEVRLYDPEPWRHGASAYRFALHYAADGTPDGYLYFRVKGGSDHTSEVTVVALDAASAPAYAALWRFVLDLDLVHRFTRSDARSTSRSGTWSPIRGRSTPGSATARTHDWSMCTEPWKRGATRRRWICRSAWRTHCCPRMPAPSGCRAGLTEPRSAGRGADLT